VRAHTSRSLAHLP